MNRAASADPYARLKDNALRELAEIDARLERGEIDEADRLFVVNALSWSAPERLTYARARSWGCRIAGRSERTNRHKPAVDYRVLWVDSEEGR